jgi:hypothetical protein
MTKQEGKKKAVPGFEPGLREGDYVSKYLTTSKSRVINHYTTQPYGYCHLYT